MATLDSQFKPVLFLSLQQVNLETFRAALGPVPVHSTVTLLPLTDTPSFIRCSEHTGESICSRQNKQTEHNGNQNSSLDVREGLSGDIYFCLGGKGGGGGDIGETVF